MWPGWLRYVHCSPEGAGAHYASYRRKLANIHSFSSLRQQDRSRCRLKDDNIEHGSVLLVLNPTSQDQILAFMSNTVCYTSFLFVCGHHFQSLVSDKTPFFLSPSTKLKTAEMVAEDGPKRHCVSSAVLQSEYNRCVIQI